MLGEPLRVDDNTKSNVGLDNTESSSNVPKTSVPKTDVPEPNVLETSVSEASILEATPENSEPSAPIITPVELNNGGLLFTSDPQLQRNNSPSASEPSDDNSEERQ